MSEFGKSRQVKATRTTHTCEACARDIPPGSPAFYWAGKIEGEFYNLFRHVDCSEAEQAWNDWAGFAWDEYCNLWHFYDERAAATFTERGAPATFIPTIEAKWPLVLERLQARELDRQSAPLSESKPA